MQITLIFTRKVVHLASLVLGSGLFSRLQIFEQKRDWSQSSKGGRKYRVTKRPSGQQVKKHWRNENRILQPKKTNTRQKKKKREKHRCSLQLNRMNIKINLSVKQNWNMIKRTRLCEKRCIILEIFLIEIYLKVLFSQCSNCRARISGKANRLLARLD